LKAKLPRLETGTRTVIAGRTGSGKTTLAAYLMEKRSRQHWAILNPKHTAGYKDLPDAVVMDGWKPAKFDKLIEKHRFVVINFHKEQTKAEPMDDCLTYIHDGFEDIGIACDELYYLHVGGKAGDGLTGVLTRGRERNQTFLGLMQRPAWVSRFCFSEADNIVCMALNLEDDRKRVFEMTGDERFMSSLPKRHWRWYNVDADMASLWGPVPLNQARG
jgi:energy-coupling factor transporter ATP-binding protein EcfA2